MDAKALQWLLGQLGVKQIRRSGNNFMVSCLFAPWTHTGGTDRKPSMGITYGAGKVSLVNCFACGFKGTVLHLVKSYGRYAVQAGLMTKEQVDELANFALLAEDEEIVLKQGAEEDQEESIPDEVYRGIGVWHDYWRERGITRESFDEWKLGFLAWAEDPETHRLKKVNRALLPFLDKKGRIVGAIGRATRAGEEPKYLYFPKHFRKGQYLFGEHLLVPGLESLVVVEGQIDAIRVSQVLKGAGLWDEMRVVSISGSKATDMQLAKLGIGARELIIAMDNDYRGKVAQKALVQALEFRTRVSVVRYPDDVPEGEDPASLGERFLDLLEKRVSAPRFEVEHLEIVDDVGWRGGLDRIFGGIGSPELCD